MWLLVPSVIKKVLWEGPLEPVTDEAIERMSREWAVKGLKMDARNAVRDLPLMSIGQPEVWPLTEVYSLEN